MSVLYYNPPPLDKWLKSDKIISKERKQVFNNQSPPSSRDYGETRRKK
jgi:hypothetical protein